MQVVDKRSFAITAFFNSVDLSTTFNMRLLSYITFVLFIFNLQENSKIHNVPFSLKSFTYICIIATYQNFSVEN